MPTLTPKPPKEKRVEPSSVEQVSSGSGVSFAAAKVVIDKVLERRPRKKSSAKTPAGVA